MCATGTRGERFLHFFILLVAMGGGRRANRQLAEEVLDRLDHIERLLGEWCGQQSSDQVAPEKQREEVPDVVGIVAAIVPVAEMELVTWNRESCSNDDDEGLGEDDDLPPLEAWDGIKDDDKGLGEDDDLPPLEALDEDGWTPLPIASTSTSGVFGIFPRSSESLFGTSVASSSSTNSIFAPSSGGLFFGTSVATTTSTNSIFAPHSGALFGTSVAAPSLSAGGGLFGTSVAPSVGSGGMPSRAEKKSKKESVAVSFKDDSRARQDDDPVTAADPFQDSPYFRDLPELWCGACGASYRGPHVFCSGRHDASFRDVWEPLVATHDDHFRPLMSRDQREQGQPNPNS